MTYQKKERFDNLFYMFENIFKYVFLTLSLFSFNNLLAGSFLLKAFALFVAAFGSIIVMYRLLNAKKYIRFYLFPLLILFAISYFISSIINIKYGIVENIQALLWMVFHFAILYATDTTSPAEKGTKNFIGLLNYFLTFIFVSNLVSLGMLFAGFGRAPYNSFNGNIMGLTWGRLWGIYTDPNIGSVLSVAAIYISLYFIYKTQVTYKKVLLFINIFISLCYISFSDSRTGLLTFMFTAFVYTYILLIHTKKIKAKAFVRQLTALACALVISATSLLSIVCVKNTYNTITTLTSNLSTNESDSSENDENSIGRTGDELEGDISNRRFSLWASGIEVWKKTPVFGTSHRNLVNFALQNTPKTYLVNNDREGNFDTTHNAYIDVLVSQGIIGAIIFVIVFVSILLLIFKKLIFTYDSTCFTVENLLLIGLILTFATSAAFILEIVYINSAGAFIFWLSLGKLVKNLKECNHD